MIAFFLKQWLKGLVLTIAVFSFISFSPEPSKEIDTSSGETGILIMLLVVMLIILTAVVFLSIKVRLMVDKNRYRQSELRTKKFQQYLDDLGSGEIEQILKYIQSMRSNNNKASSAVNVKAGLMVAGLMLTILFPSSSLLAQKK